MKTAAIIANEMAFAEYIKENLDLYFKGYLKTRAYKVEQIEATSIEEEVVVLSSWTIFNKIKDKMRPEIVLQTVSFTLSKENIRVLEETKPTGRALAVNCDYRLCMQMITQLYEAGYDDIDLIPYYGNEAQRDKSITLALTPNEMGVAPEGVKVINLGERVIELNCILELANKLGIKGVLDSAEAKAARDNIVLPQWSLDKLLSENDNVSDNIKALIEYIEDGIAICDNSGRIYLSNEKAKRLLRADSPDGFEIGDLLRGIDLNQESQDSGMIIDVEGKKLVVTNTFIRSGGRKSGNMIVLKNFDEMEDRQHGIRKRLSGEKYEARYSFSDIQGESRQIKEVIDIARRIARSDSSVMITGESGTGKELFAQSIHNASRRSRYNFVALNCAAIPENLLESELFGYEEGAFTGAKKGGKTGYFELAHQGTIFLDEIAEMPIALQSKLLRVIEEGEIAKIGSSKLIPIDVRIIAATNKNLKELMITGAFREDLYYRLNVLPLKLPSLNQREGDILVLFDYFRRKIGARWTCSEETKRLLLRHVWRGNIREVRNVVEYLDSLEQEIIEPADLPEDILTGSGADRSELAAAEAEWDSQTGGGEDREFMLREGRNLHLHLCVLTLLEKAKSFDRRLGRNQLKAEMQKEGVSYSETEIRNSLRKLSEAGYIRTLKGRGGSGILPSGERLLKKIKGLAGE